MEGRFWRSSGSAINRTFTDAQRTGKGFQAESVALRLLSGLVLVGAFNDGAIDGSRFERSSVLTQEFQPLQVGGREEPGDGPRMSKTDLPEPNVMAVGHEPEGGIGLLLGDLGDVVDSN